MAKKHQIYARSSRSLKAVHKKERRRARSELKQYEGATVNHRKNGRSGEYYV